MQVIFPFRDTKRFLTSLPTAEAKKVPRSLELLQEFGKLLSFPDSRKVGNNLYELRTRGKNQIRLLYCFHEGRAYVLHAFLKKTQKLSLSDLHLAQQRKKLIENI